MPPVVPPFLIGLVVAPLAKRVAKPLLRGIVKTSVGLAMEVRKVAHEAGEGIQDIAAEVTAEMVAAQVSADGERSQVAPGHSGKDGAPGSGDGSAHKPRAAAKAH